MPRAALKLPTADEFYRRLDGHPPWQGVSGPELGKLLGVGVNWVWNHTMRGNGPEPEPVGLYPRASNRRFFLPAIVLAWLDPETTAVGWCRHRLIELHMLLPDRAHDPDQIMASIAALERPNLLRRRWRVTLPAYLARLEEVVKGSETGQGSREVKTQPWPGLNDSIGI